MLYVSGSIKSTLSGVPSVSKGGVNTIDVPGITHSDSSNTVHVVSKEGVNITDVFPDHDIVIAKGGVNTTGVPVIRESINAIDSSDVQLSGQQSADCPCFSKPEVFSCSGGKIPWFFTISA